MGILDDLRLQREEWLKSQGRHEVDLGQEKTLEELQAEAEEIEKQREEERKAAQKALLEVQARSRVTVNRERAQAALNQIANPSSWTDLVDSNAATRKQLNYIRALLRDCKIMYRAEGWNEPLQLLDKIIIPRSKARASSIIDALLRTKEQENEEDVVDILRMVI